MITGIVPAEIHAEADAIRATLAESLPAARAAAAALREAGTRRIHVIGNGTSHHSSLAAATLWRRHAGADDPTVIALNAGEFRNYLPALGAGDAVIGISASGEFRDVLAVVDELRGRVPTVGIVHVAGSTLDRSADHVVRSAGGPSGVPVVVRVINSAGVTALLEESKPVGHEHLHVFPLLEEVCNPQVLLGGTRETLARAIHEEYVAHQTREGQTRQTNPAMVAWDALSKTLKESNRDQAADIGTKLAAVGCGITNLTDWDAELLEFTPEEVETLSRMEHDRWMGERLAAGWTFAPGPKDVGRKTHPDLVPYEKLTEEKRGLDRSAVRGIPAFLARAGFHAYRL